VEEIFGIIPLDNEVIGTPILWRELRGKGETVDERSHHRRYFHLEEAPPLDEE